MKKILSLNIIILCLSILSLAACRPETSISLNRLLNAKVTSVLVVNGQLVISGSNLGSVNAVKLKNIQGENSFTVESVSSQKIVAKGLQNLSLIADGIFELILSNANASATFQINFDVADGSVTAAKLNAMGATSGQVLSFDGTSWAPGNAIDPLSILKARGFNMLDALSEKSFTVDFLGAANEKVMLYFPTGKRLQGTYEVTVGSGYNGGNCSGSISKRFSGYGRSTGTFSGKYIDVPYASDYMRVCYTISDPQWDAVNLRWYFAIANLNGNFNLVHIHIKSFTASAAIQLRADEALISAPYTTDTTVFEALSINYAGNLGIGTTAPTATLDVKGHVANTGTAATLGACGTTPVLTGNDTKGYVTVGSGATTTCVINFNAAYTTAPVCVATWRTNASTIGLGVSATTTALSVKFTADAQGLSFNYQCMQ